MSKKMTKAMAAVVSVSLLCGLAGCGKSDASSGTSSTASSSNTSKEESSGEKTYDEALTIDMFNWGANYQGIMTGWFANIVEKKFNMKINIIAPNVAGGGETLYQTRSAAGNLGDLITIQSREGRLDDCVKAGLLYDITDMMADSKNLGKYSVGIRAINDIVDKEKIYCIPSAVSESSPLKASEGIDPTYGAYLRWDYYAEAGYPEMDTMEDLLDVMKIIQDAHPTSDSGKKTYSFSLFRDWDENMMCLAKQFACMYGYDEVGFNLLSADGSDVQNILDDGGIYYRTLKFYYNANQMGLMDPDSTTQNYDTLYAKYQDGQVLFSPWPWLPQPAYNTVEHTEEGKGFMLAPVKDMQIFSYGCAPSNPYVMAVGSQAKDPERMFDFIDWLYSPEGVSLSTAQTTSTCGIKDLFYTIGSNGKPVLTDFGNRAFKGDAELLMPDEYGGGTYKEGVSQLNFQTVATADVNPELGEPYNYNMWESTIQSLSTPLAVSWQERMGGFLTTMEYLEENGMVSVAPGNTYVPEAEGIDVENIRNQIRAIIVANSWQMCFAANKAEFERLWKEMKETAEGLGIETVNEFYDGICASHKSARDAARAAVE